MPFYVGDVHKYAGYLISRRKVKCRFSSLCGDKRAPQVDEKQRDDDFFQKKCYLA